MNSKSFTTIDSLQSQIEEAEHSPKTAQLFYESINNLAKIYQAWIHAGQSSEINELWLENVKNEYGNPLFEKDEIPKYTKILDKLFSNLNSILQNTETNLTQHVQQNTQQGGTLPRSDLIPPDEIIQIIMDRISAVDEMSRKYARQYGLLKLLDDSDQGKRKNLRTPVIPEIGLVASFPIPPRLIIMVAYSLLEIIRALVSGVIPVIRSDMLARLLSLIIGTIDILFGRWKQAILSYSGFFGPNILFSSMILKLAMDVFYILSPDIRKEVVFTTIDSFKSLLIGLLITSFQTFAPAPIRAKVDSALRYFNQTIEEINNQLISSGLEPLPPEMYFSFGSMNNLQIFIRKPEIICSKEMEEIMNIFSEDAPILGFALQLMGFPTDSDRRREICRKSGYELGVSTLMELLVFDSKKRTDRTLGRSKNSERSPESMSALLSLPDTLNISRASQVTPQTLVSTTLTPDTIAQSATKSFIQPAVKPIEPVEQVEQNDDILVTRSELLEKPQITGKPQTIQPIQSPPPISAADVLHDSQNRQRSQRQPLPSHVQIPSIPSEIPKSNPSASLKKGLFGKLNSLRGKTPRLSAAAVSPRKSFRVR